MFIIINYLLSLFIHYHNLLIALALTGPLHIFFVVMFLLHRCCPALFHNRSKCILTDKHLHQEENGWELFFYLLVFWFVRTLNVFHFLNAPTLDRDWWRADRSDVGHRQRRLHRREEHYRRQEPKKVEAESEREQQEKEQATFQTCVGEHWAVGWPRRKSCLGECFQL